MLQFPAPRRQTDEMQKSYSEATWTDASESADNPALTRQEFAADADINVILKRFGVMGTGPQLREPMYGEADYDVGLMEAVTYAYEAERAWEALPIEVRRRYRTWQEMLRAVTSGELEINPPGRHRPTDEPAADQAKREKTGKGKKTETGDDAPVTEPDK